MATASHYQSHTADSYEKAYFYEAGAYQQYLVDLVRDRLQLSQKRTTATTRRHILDIGGGTGNFAQALVSDKNYLGTAKVTVVDPFLNPKEDMLSSSTDGSESQISFVQAPAEAFLKPANMLNDDMWRDEFHQVLLKEVVHHLDNRVGIFRGIYDDLKPIPPLDNSITSSTIEPTPPSLLIITRPQTDIDYPLWDAARQVWKDNQPSAEEFSRELNEAGFANIQHTLEAYPCQIALNRWLSMVKARFWSTFSNFNDKELENACQQIAIDYKDRIDKDGVIHFEDRLVFISASKVIK